MKIRLILMADSVVTQLISNGVIEEREVGGTQFLRFQFDSLAEYMAALYWVHKFRDSEAPWKARLAELREVEGYPRSMSGFLVALEDCVKAYGDDFRIPTRLDFPWNSG